ncbi:hypothetical protein NW762_013791 [Fusarium torreyae]|uniref:Uncharacterized protein n=1 Tax=Fusarium torreyae TaxID=1237075 RepID=A0A9W8V8F1_9HYPO|nr:hypothetical protein NW762_013791 [Fusarium torreyae]
MKILAPLIAAHGDFSLGLTIREIFSIFYGWLDNHPTEAIVVQIKADGKGVNEQAVSNDVGALIKDKTRYWAIGETVPSLTQIKGKIQLVRRLGRPDADGAAETFGINALNWPENTQNEIKNTLINKNSTPVRLSIQDNYTFYDNGATALQKKTKYITDFVAKAVSSPKATTDPWFIGFSSYTTTGGIPDSNFNYAAKSLGGNKPMNEALEKCVKLQGGHGKPARVGTLLMDYPNWNSGTLIESIIYTNDLNLAG